MNFGEIEDYEQNSECNQEKPRVQSQEKGDIMIKQCFLRAVRKHHQHRRPMQVKE